MAWAFCFEGDILESPLFEDWPACGASAIKLRVGHLSIFPKLSAPSIRFFMGRIAETPIFQIFHVTVPKFAPDVPSTLKGPHPGFSVSRAAHTKVMEISKRASLK